MEDYRIWKVSSIQILIFVPVRVVVFLTSFFRFYRAFYYFTGKILFLRSLPIQKYLSDGNFPNCLPTERVFTEQEVGMYLFVKCQKFTDIKKTMPFKLNTVFT